MKSKTTRIVSADDSKNFKAMEKLIKKNLKKLVSVDDPFSVEKRLSILVGSHAAAYVFIANQKLSEDFRAFYLGLVV